MTANPGEVTLLLRDWKSGIQRGESKLFELLMPDLRRIAGHCFARERPGQTLKTHCARNEALLKLAATKNVDSQDRAHSLDLVTALGAALEELAPESRHRRMIVELKCFLGFTDADAADALKLSLRTMQREWYRARKWLFERLTAQTCKLIPKTTNG